MNTWLVVWNIFLCFHTLGISSSQLTIFQRGRYNHQPATKLIGNANHTTYKNGDDWGIVYYCFNHIILKPHTHI